MSHFSTRLTPLEVFGLQPLDKALADARLAVFGKGEMQPTRFDHTSLKIFKPRLGFPAWAGKIREDKKAPILNFFNRRPAPKHEGYSVRVTYCQDFLGGQNTYDGHLGTDFVVPVGTPVTAAAPGKVLRVINHFDRGGLKVVIDHGRGLMTTSNHLGRALVKEGELVKRGQVIALAGASGLDLLVFFPWVAPHLHFNVWLNGEPVDPFAIEAEGEMSLWKTRDNHPTPHTEGEEDGYEPTAWEAPLLKAGIGDCVDAAERVRLSAFTDLEEQAVELLISRNFRSYLYREFPPLYKKHWPRRPMLDLPFRAEEFSGVALPGE